MMINYSLDNQNSIEDIVLMNMYTRHRDTFRERIPASIIFKEKGDFACSIFYVYYSPLHSVIHMCVFVQNIFSVHKNCFLDMYLRKITFYFKSTYNPDNV